MARSERDRELESKLGVFVRQYARKRHPGQDPNDRRYDRELEKKIRQMDPEELDRLMHGRDPDEGDNHI